MRFFKITIFTFLSLILFLILAIGGTVIWITKNPQSAWNTVEKRLLPQDLQITWDEIELRTKHLGAFNFHIDFRIEGLRIKKQMPLTDIPLDSIHLETSIFPFSSNQKILIHKLVFQSSQDLMSTSATSEAGKVSNPFQYLKKLITAIHWFKKHIEVQNIDIRIKSLRLEQLDGNSDTISFSLANNLNQQPKSVDFRLLLKSGKDSTLTTFGNIVSASDENALLLNGEVKGEISEFKIKQTIKLKLLDDSVAGLFNGSVYYKTKETQVGANNTSELKMDIKGIDLDLNLSHLLGVSSDIVLLRMLNAHFITSFAGDGLWTDNPTKVSIAAPLEILSFDAKLKAHVERVCECILPTKTLLQIDGKTWLSSLFSESENKSRVANFSAQIQNLSNKLFSLRAAVTLNIDKYQNNFLFVPNLNIDAEIYHFLKLGQILAEKRILIPAPFDILDGTIGLHINGPMQWTPKGSSIPLLATANLASKDQLINLKLTSDIQLSADFTSANVDTDLMIDALQFELPPLSPTQGNPRVLIDKRVLRKIKSAKKPNSFKLTFNYRVHTKEPNSIRLLSKFFKPHLPVGLDVQYSADNKTSGNIRIDAFDIVYLRRQVHVERMSIDLKNADKNVFYVDGRLSVKQTQYTVFIDIKGPANKPNIVLSSDPYLSRSEIISVLLYNRTSDQLASTDAQTAGHVEAAIADRAIGLFGIWAFASTPIKSFSYNPATQIYTATIELADGVSTSIGTNWEAANQVALSKRVSRRWTVTAAWMPADEDQDPRTKLVLQWEQRF